MSVDGKNTPPIKGNDRFYFSDETGQEFVSWIGLNEDLEEYGYNTKDVVKHFKRKGAFSFEDDGTRIRCKIYGVKSDIYKNGFIGCFIRFSRGPKSKITSISISDKFAYSIDDDMKIDESYEEVRKIILRHYKYHLSDNILEQLPYLSKKFFWKKYRQLMSYRRTVGFAGGASVSSLVWNWEAVFQNLKHLWHFLFR